MAPAAVEEKTAAAAAAEAAIEEKEAESTVSIDVDVEDNVMEWEVETEPAEEPAEAYIPEEPYDDYSGIPVARSINKHVFVLVFSYALGIFGVDRFVRGQTIAGLAKLLTFGGLGFWYLADLVVAVIKAYGGPYRGMDDLLFDINGRYIY